MESGTRNYDDKELIKKITELVIAEIKKGKEKQNANAGSDPDNIRVGVSVRHVHLSQADLETLFGKGYKLNHLRDLYQEGEFASKETVTLVGPRLRSIQDVRVLGPLRKQTQVEVSRTDSIFLGIDPPVRPSGVLEGSAPITLVGPKGSITLKEGTIIANRHIHMSPADAARFGVKDNDLVNVEVGGEKAVIFKNVQIRVKDNFKLEMHLDTDDANAAGITCGVPVRIVK